MRNTLRASLFAACLLVAGYRDSRACYSCSTGQCDFYPARTDCITTYANGVWYCSLSGNWCAAGGGDGDDIPPKLPPPHSRNQPVTTMVVVALTDRALSTLFPHHVNAVAVAATRGIMETPVALLARYTGLDAAEFSVKSAAMRFGNSARPPVLNVGKSARIAIQVDAADPGRATVTVRDEDSGEHGAAQSLEEGAQALITPIVIDGKTYVLVVTSERIEPDQAKAAREVLRRTLINATGTIDITVDQRRRVASTTWGAIKIIYR